jgi:hypothetical protein
MKKSTAALAMLIYLLLFWATAFADVSVTLKMDRVEATLVDTVQMQVSVSGTRAGNAAPVLKGMESFQVTQGGTSSRVEIVNGSVSSSVDFTYFIQPQKTGTFTIGPAEIEVDGRKLSSNTVTLDVTKASQSSGAGTGTGPVFIEASISTDDIYVEEQSIYTIKLYHRVDVDELSLKLPEVAHVSFKQLGQPHNYQTVYAGVSYAVMEVRYALLASKAGGFVIGPSRMNMIVPQAGGRSMFNNFFNDPFFKDPFSSFSSGRPLHLSTRPIDLTVHDLPQKDKPADFSGLVGDFKMTSQLEPARLKAGESATLTIRVSGRGNTTRIPDIDFPELSFAQVYGDQPVLESTSNGHGIGGTKTMKWALVPEKEGRFEIPEFMLSFFNPDTHTYHTLRTPRQALTVLPGKKQEVAVFNASSHIGKNHQEPLKRKIQQIGEDILPIHTAAKDLSVPFRTLASGWRFWPTLFGPVIVYLLLLAGSNLRNRSRQGLKRSRAKNAFRKFKKRYQAVQNDGAGILDAFTAYLNDKLNLCIGTLTADDMVRFLGKQHVNGEVVNKIRQNIEMIESAVYAGNDVKKANMADDFLKLVKALEKEIR